MNLRSGIVKDSASPELKRAKTDEEIRERRMCLCPNCYAKYSTLMSQLQRKRKSMEKLRLDRVENSLKSQDELSESSTSLSSLSSSSSSLNELLDSLSSDSSSDSSPSSRPSSSPSPLLVLDEC